jgi:hypothetical protein
MAIEIISTLKPKNNGSFPIAEAKDITVDENGTRLDAKLTELANNAGSGGGGGGIIDVAELPTEGIDESALYRVLVGTVYYGEYKQQTKVHIVNGLPETGENVSADMKTIDHTYYNTADGVEYVYMSETLASAVGMAGGWYPASTMYTGLGYAYGGVVTSMSDMTATATFYLYLEFKLYSYKNKWEALKGIGWSGTNSGAEVFNDFDNIASGVKAHAEGNDTTASGECSHAEGNDTTASGSRAHAEGGDTTASGFSAHAEGSSTTASGSQSHAEGLSTTASGDKSHAEGYLTKASGENQHVQGRNNIEDTENKYAHIVGNGAPSVPRNAHTLDWDGNAWYAGTVEGTALILASSTEYSTKRFKITVDDSGKISATELT